MPSEVPAPPVRPGDLLAGRYRVVRLLGAGGMGVVVEAEHVGLAHRVAIKFLNAAAADRASAVERFLQEARAAVRLRGEHVARVTDVGRLENGSPYIVMEYLEGQDLAQAIQAGGPMPVELAVGFLLQACEAVAEAHALGIIHRDLKPANLFLARAADGTWSVKVLDFGISKLTDPAVLGLPAPSLTGTSDVIGSPQYMSPEQMRSSKMVDGRTDVWSLGVILYEALCGIPPFLAETMPELVLRIATSDPQPLHEVRPDVGLPLSDVVMRALAKEREDRYPTVAKLAEALAPFGGPRAVRSLESIRGLLGSAGMLSAPPPGSGGQDPAFLSTVEAGSAPTHRRALGPLIPAIDTAGAWSEAKPATTRRSSKLAAGVLLALMFAVGGVAAVATIWFSRSSAVPAATGSELESPPPSPDSVAVAKEIATPRARGAIASATELRPAASASSAPAALPAAVPRATRPRPARPSTGTKADPFEDPLADQR